MISMLLNQDITAHISWLHSAAIYLHAVIFIIHVLDPGNELTSVETISHRFVFITLRKQIKLQCRWCYNDSLKVTYNRLITLVCICVFSTWLSDGMLYTSESRSMVQALNGTAWLAIVLAALQWTLNTSCSHETISFSCEQEDEERK